MTVETDVDAEFDAYYSTLKSKQDTYFGTNARYFQGLQTHTAIPSDGVATAPDLLASKPSYQSESWNDISFTPGATTKHALRVDPFSGPDGPGWRAITLINIDGIIKHKIYHIDEDGNKTDGTWAEAGTTVTIPTIGQTAEDTGADGATLDVGLASPTSGSLLIVVGASSDGAFATPTGFTRIGANTTEAIYYKISDGSETSILMDDGTGKGDGDLSAICVEIKNSHATSPLGDGDESSNTRTSPASDISAEGVLAISVGINVTGGASGGYQTPGAGWELAKGYFNANQALGVGWKKMINQTSTGTMNWEVETYTTSRVRTMVILPNG